MSRVVLRVEARQRSADEAALALRSQGIDARTVRRPEGFLVTVAEVDFTRAEEVLALYAEENRPEPDPEPLADQPFPWLEVGTVLAAMAAFYLVTGPRAEGSVWFQEGSARASRILIGEWWRTVTALCLHADVGHLAGNVLSGLLFFGFVGRRLGAGVTILLVVVAGGLANGVNAFLHGSRHDSVGASTAVFAAVGLLSALAAVAPARARRRYLVAIGAGLAILAMMGTGGERTDLWAHFFGLVVGFALGLPVALAAPDPPRAALQVVAGALAAGLVAGCWTLALQGA